MVIIKLIVINSGSKGNCYLLKTDNECLVIENGVPFMEVKKALDFNVSQIVGNLCSHRHGDHHKYTNEYRKAGIPTFCPFEQDENEVAKKSVKFGGFTIQCFPLIHDVPCYGFYIKHKECGKCLFITDTECVRQVFKNLKVEHIFVECNYMSEMVDKSLPQYEHKLRHHMSLSTCKDFIKANATDSLQTILLLHLGLETCEPKEVIAEVQKVAKCPVYVAEKGVCVELRNNDCPF